MTIDGSGPVHRGPKGKPRRYYRKAAALGEGAFSIFELVCVIGVLVSLAIGGLAASSNNLRVVVVGMVVAVFCGLTALSWVTVWPDRSYFLVRNYGFKVRRVDWPNVNQFDVGALKGRYGRTTGTTVFIHLKDGERFECRGLRGHPQSTTRFINELDAELAKHQPASEAAVAAA